MDFQGFPKIPRLSRNIVVTEKIDGTLGMILITPNLEFGVGSKNRWITPEQDNHGFAAWAYVHKDELIAGLGAGRHFGEWWGSGIQRGYGLVKGEKRFSLFNTYKWSDDSVRPACCHVVPVITIGNFTTDTIEFAINVLREVGSLAAPGYQNPEGICIFHTAANTYFKKTLLHDEVPKSLQKG